MPTIKIIKKNDEISQRDADTANYPLGGKQSRVDMQVTTAQNKELQEAIRKTIKIKIKKQGYAETMKAIFQIPEGNSTLLDLQELDDEEERQKLGGKLTAQETYSLWCTLSPEPGTTTWIEMQQSMEKLSKKKGVAWMMWSHEQSGTSSQANIGSHPHVHFLIILDKQEQSGQATRMKCGIESTLKGYRTKNDCYLQVRACGYADQFKTHKSKIAYMLGQKTDKKKQPQVDADKIWREQQGIEEYYCTDPNM